MTQQQYAQVSDVAMAQALATAGWKQPVSGVPIPQLCIPVIVVGGAPLPTYKSAIASGVAVGSNGFVGLFPAVPAGKQWRIMKAAGHAPNGGFLGVAPQGYVVTGSSEGYLGVDTTTLGTNVTELPAATSVQPTGQPLALLKAGDIVGYVGGIALDAVTLMIFYEETNVPLV